ncbi:MAG: hypothetical protein JO224_04555 [Pelomonas sp.]|nr:hypothetical protein [Roseateles sp.]
MPPRFDARSEPGQVLPDAADLHAARKREFLVRVRFAAVAGELQTPEGRVQVQPGDAIVSDDKGRTWRVSRHHFDAKYERVDAEQFRSRRVEVRTRRMAEAFEVLLADHRSLLRGAPGDWLVDYGDGSLGVVSDTAFAASYDLID